MDPEEIAILQKVVGTSEMAVKRQEAPKNDNQDDTPAKRKRNMFKLKLEAPDGTIVEVEEDVVNVSHLLRGMIENLNIESPEDPRLKETIPVTHVSGDMLKKVMEFCTHYRDREYVEKSKRDTNQVPLDDWDKEFMDISVDRFTELFQAANYLNVPGLMEIQAQKVANLFENLSVEQLRDAFGVVNDFTPQEEEELRKQYAWAETWNFNK